MSEKEGKRKAKLPMLVKILHEKTDDLHGLTMKQIIEELAYYDIPAERKRIGDDFETLRDFGIDVVKRRKGRSVEYAIEKRIFSLEEMIWLADAVQSCPSLTEEMTDTLIEHLKLLASKSQRKMLEKRVDVPGRVKMRNESVFDNLDMLQQCLRKKKVARFRYFKYDASGQRLYKYNDWKYTYTPVRLVYAEGFYYFVGWHEEHKKFTNFRVDRMTDIEVGEEDAVVNREIKEYDPPAMEPTRFGMWGNELKRVTLVVDASEKDSVVSVIKDKFGDNAVYTDIGGDKCRVSGRVAPGPVFYGWIATLGNRVRITKPDSIVEAYKQHLCECMEPYEE